MASIEEILLKLRSSGFSEADTALAKLEERLKSLGGTTARPSVDVDDTAAKAKLDETQAKLERVGSEHVTAKVDVDTRQATRALDELKFHGISAMQGLGVAALAVGPQIVASLGQGIVGAGALGIALGGAVTAFGILGLAAKSQLDAASKAQKVNSALVIADTKKVAAAQQAVLAAEASGNAKSVAGAQQRLALAQQQLDAAKAQASAQGNLANQVVTGAKDIKKAFVEALGPGTHELFRGILSLFDTVKGSLGGLRGPFKTLGTAIKDALSDPKTQAGVKALIDGFGKMVTAVGPLAGPLLQGFIALGRILLNIATGAMPFLVEHAQKFADYLERIVGRTGDADHLHEVIAKLVGEFDRWLGFARDLIHALAPLFTGEAGKGIQDVMNGLVLVLGALAQLLAALGPAGRLVGAGLAIAALSLKFKGLKTAIGLAADGVIFLLAKLGLLKTAEEGGFIASLVGGKLKGRAGRAAAAAGEGAAAGGAGGLLSKGKGLIAKAAPAIGGALVGAGAVAVEALGGISLAAVAVPAAIAAALAGAVLLVYHFRDAIWGALKAAFVKFPSIVIAAVGGFLPAVGGAFAAPLALAFHFRDKLWGVVKATFGALAGIVRGVAGAVAGAASFVFNGVIHAIASAAGGVKHAVTSIVSTIASTLGGLASAGLHAGTALIENVGQGILNAAVGLYNKAKGVVNSVVGLFPGSEPKDPSSPFRGLGKRGKAIITNMAAGVDGAPLHAALRKATVVPPTVSASSAQPTTGTAHFVRHHSEGHWRLLHHLLDTIISQLKAIRVDLVRSLSSSGGFGDSFSTAFALSTGRPIVNVDSTAIGRVTRPVQQVGANIGKGLATTVVHPGAVQIILQTLTPVDPRTHQQLAATVSEAVKRAVKPSPPRSSSYGKVLRG